MCNARNRERHAKVPREKKAMKVALCLVATAADGVTHCAISPRERDSYFNYISVHHFGSCERNSNGIADAVLTNRLFEGNLVLFGSIRS